MRQYVLPHFEPKESHKFSPEFMSIVDENSDSAH